MENPQFNMELYSEGQNKEGYKIYVSSVLGPDGTQILELGFPKVDKTWPFLSSMLLPWEFSSSVNIIVGNNPTIQD